FPPKKGFAAACCIHEDTWCSSRSSTDDSSTPRVDLPMPLGVTGGSGLISLPPMNINFTWTTKTPDQEHHPPPTPQYAIPHFTARWRLGNVLAAKASTRSAIPRCGCGKLAI